MVDGSLATLSELCLSSDGGFFHVVRIAVVSTGLRAVFYFRFGGFRYWLGPLHQIFII